ncbi:hypothetical protein KUV57_20255, partial [Epibacterium sp. DP7N7-1]|nr:hypothetical protein [Epibacterium sp. DP7N7-1]
SQKRNAREDPPELTTQEQQLVSNPQCCDQPKAPIQHLCKCRYLRFADLGAQRSIWGSVAKA